MAKHIIMVHGRHYKPDGQILKNNWVEALEHGIQRDCGRQILDTFKQTHKTLAYYGDLSNAFLNQHSDNGWDEQQALADNEDRRHSLSALKQYAADQFNQANYRKMRKLINLLAESAAGLFSGPLSLLKMGDAIVDKLAPDIAHYWNPNTQFGSDVRWSLTVPLEKAISDGDDILLIAHSLGSIVGYDVLWKLSHYGEYRYLEGQGVNYFVTLGSPLGDENVKKKLKGAIAEEFFRYPHNINHWFNFSAEDDFISHDPTIANDFEKMLQLDLINSITDQRIYNLAIREGHSNPHHGTGYLIHPEVIRTIESWLAL